MPIFSNFCGGFYQALSPTIAADQAVNVYTETREVPGSPKAITLYGTPGRVIDGTVAAADCRGWFTQDGQTWVVVGSDLFERVSAGVYVSRGTILDDGAPVSFASNGAGGNQLAIVGGGQMYVLDLLSNALTIVALPFVGPVMIAFLDGYGLILQADSPIVWYTALEDFTSVDALDFFARSGTSDNLVGIAVARDRVWCLGSKTSTLFYDSGDADNPFLPYPGTAMQTGLVSPWLMGLYNDTLYWVAQSARGERRVVRAVDPTAQDISTPPIQRFLVSSASLDDAELLIYEQNGHAFVAITLPSSTEDIQTYVFDVRENLWHARAGWDAVHGVYTRWGAKGSTSAQGVILVGDPSSGNLYTLDLDAYDDAGDILKRERAAPYLSDDNQWLFLSQVQLGMQAGVGLATGQGSAPVVNLEISRDGARTWASVGQATLGAIGGYLARAIWRPRCRSRADLLVLRVTQTDPVKCVWNGLWFRTLAGTGEL